MPCSVWVRKSKVEENRKYCRMSEVDSSETSSELSVAKLCDERLSYSDELDLDCVQARRYQ